VIRRATVQREDGMTLVEVLIASIVLVVGIFSVIAAYDAVRRLSSSSEAQTVRAQVAEKDMQLLLSGGYAALGLSSTPAHSTDPNNPAYYVNSGSFQWDLTNTSRTEPLCTSTNGCGGSIAPGPTAWSSGGQSGNIYRFITWVDDPCDPNAPGICAGTTDYKRVTIMVTQNHMDAPTKPLLISEIVTNPNAS
jgi:Tfp pilus assembly protein PilV